MIITISASVLALLLAYTTYNLLKKLETYEKAAIKQQELISHFTQAVNLTNEKLKEIDEKGAFASDDEIGWFFTTVKELQELMNGASNPENLDQ